MSENRERILKLQEKMQELNIDMYLVPTADFHQSEYVGITLKPENGFLVSVVQQVHCL